MKHVPLLCCFALFVQFSFAQLSEGGTPWSVKFNQDISTLEFAEMPSVNLIQLQAEDQQYAHEKSRPYRFGYDHYIHFNLHNAGDWKTVPEGRIWRLGIVSQHATSMSLSFQNLHIPEGGKLFVMNPRMTSHLGAFSQRFVSEDGMLGTELIPGDSIVIEYFEPQGAEGQSSIEIFRVTHGYRSLSGGLQEAFGNAGNCNNNVNCALFSAYEAQKRSVVCLVNGGEFCSATLINNTCNDSTPYILTARHCGSSGFGAWVFRFNWESADCQNPASNPPSQSISGAVNRANYTGSDFRLLEMNTIPPPNFNAYYAGWNRSSTMASSAFCIHHPSGDIKKISLAPNPVTSATFGGASCWKVGLWTDGITEPGSSGAPLFDQDGRIIGQLYGGPSYCGCENDNDCGTDYYGKFSTSWAGGGNASNRLSDWLDGCQVNPMTWNGFDPNISTIPLDAQLSAILSPRPNECTGNFAPTILLRNAGIDTLFNVTIYYRIDNNPYNTHSWTGQLLSGQSVQVNLNLVSGITTGTHNFKAYLAAPNNSPDQNIYNDTLTVNFTVINPTGQPIPLVEGFEASLFPPAGWSITNPDQYYTWQRSTSAGGYGNSNASAAIDHFSPQNDPTGQTDDLTTPYLDFTNQGNLVLLTFSVAHARYNNFLIDSLKVRVSIDCGNTWNTHYSKGGSELSTAPDHVTGFIPTPSEWKSETVDLSMYASFSSVLVQFRTKSGWGNWIYLDDIHIIGSTPPPTPPVAQFITSGNEICAGQTVHFSNQSINSIFYDWQFPGGNPASSTQMSPSVSYPVAGNYPVTLITSNVHGTDTAVSSVIVWALPVPVITVQNQTQLSTGTQFTGYEWKWNGTTLPGGDQYTYDVQQPGNYTVTVTDTNGCTGTSLPVNITPETGMENLQPDFAQLYPNPASHILHIQTPFTGQLLDISFMNMLGEILFREIHPTGNIQLDVSNLPTGMYMVRLDLEGNMLTRKILLYR